MQSRNIFSDKPSLRDKKKTTFCGTDTTGKSNQFLKSKLPIFLLLWIILYGTPIFAQQRQALNTTPEIPKGSWIIDMGVTPQTERNALKPYGLVYKLLEAGVPVMWVINKDKDRDGVDFYHESVNRPGGHGFKGGPFVVSSAFKDAAAPIISHWKAQGVVVDKTSIKTNYFPVFATLRAAPTWSLNTERSDIPECYLMKAGIPRYAYSETSSDALDDCDDVYLIPHDEPSSEFVDNIVSWNEMDKGFLWLGCYAGSQVHEHAKFLVTGNLTGTKGKWSGPALYDYNGEPVMQFMGSNAADATQSGGKNESYSSTNWRNKTRKLISLASDLDRVSMAYGPGFGNNNNGWVMLSGGHQYTDEECVKDSGTATIAAIRAMLNFSFYSVIEKGANVDMELGLDGGEDDVLGETNQFSYNVQVQGETSPFTAQWSSSCGGTFSPNNTSSNSTTFTLDDSSRDECTITVTLTDVCGRISFDSKTYTVSNCNLTVSPTIVRPCFGESYGRISLNASNGTGPYDYEWMRVGGGSGSGSLPGPAITIYNFGEGTYNFTLTDANDCSIAFPVEVNAYEDIELNSTVTPASCGLNNGTIDVTATGGRAPRTFQWDDQVPPGQRNKKNLTGLSAGTYMLTVTGREPTFCSKTFSVPVDNAGGPSIIEDVTDVSCYGSNDGAISLTISGGESSFSFQWSDGNTTKNRSGLSAGNYTVTVTDANGCIASKEIPVDEPDQISLSFDATHLNCAGDAGSIDLTVTGGTPGYSYSWTGPNGFSDTTLDISNLNPGTYKVTVTDANNCTQTGSQAIFSIGELTITTEVTNVDCSGGSSGAIAVTVSGGESPYNFSWTGPNSFSANTQNISNLAPGTYNLTVTDANGCEGNATAIVEGGSGGAISISGDVTDVSCYGYNDGAISLTISGGESPFSFQWSDNGPTTQNRSNLTARDYSVTVTDNNGCTASKSFTVGQPSPFSLSFQTMSPTCYEAMNGSITVTVNGGTPPFTYSWSDGNTSKDRSGLAVDYYTLVVTDENGCTASKGEFLPGGSSQINISTSPGPVKCGGGASGSISVTVNGGQFPYTFNWADLPGTDNPQNREGLAVGIYDLTVTDANNCIGTKSPEVTEPVALGISSSVTNVGCNGDASGSIALTVSGGSTPYTFLWSDGNTTQNRNAIKAGSYSVTVTDANNCTASKSGINVTEPSAAISLNFPETTHLSCFGSDDGAITVSVNGGTSPYSYDWSGNPTGDGSPGVTGLAAETYAVTVTDANGCTKVDSETLTQPSPIVLGITPANPTCPPDADVPVNSDGMITLNVLGGVGPYTYMWTTPDGAGLNPTLKDQSNLTVGMYNVTVTDNTGCTKMASVKLINLKDNPDQLPEIIKN